MGCPTSAQPRRPEGGLGDLRVLPSRRDGRRGKEGERVEGWRVGGEEEGDLVEPMLLTSSEARDCATEGPLERLRPPASADGLGGGECGAIPARGCPMRWMKLLGVLGAELGGGGTPAGPRGEPCQGGSSSSQEGPRRRLPGRDDGARKGVLCSGFTALVGGSGSRGQAWGSGSPGGLLRRDDKDLPTAGPPRRLPPGPGGRGATGGGAGGSGPKRRKLAPREGDRRGPSPLVLPGRGRTGGGDGERPGLAKGLRSDGRGGGCPQGGEGSRSPKPALSIPACLRLERL